MNKKKFRKTLVSICLAIVFMFLPIMVSGCSMGFDKDDPESMVNVFDGVKYTYYRTKSDGDYAAKVVNSAEFLVELQAQYGTLATELLFNLTANFGGGMSTEVFAATKVEATYLAYEMMTVAPGLAILFEYPVKCYTLLTDIAYMNVSLNGKYRNAINKSYYGDGDYYTTWKWRAGLEVLSQLSPIELNSDLLETLAEDLYQQYMALAFVTAEHIFKLEVALALINAGYDISSPKFRSLYATYTDVLVYDSVEIEAKLTKMFSELACSHSGICEGEEEKAVVNFILNDIIGEDVINHDVDGDKYYRNYPKMIAEIVHNTITQKAIIGNEMKYKIVGNISIKDVKIKELEDLDENGFFKEDENSGYPGYQCYKSMIFMNKVDLSSLEYLYLTFQSRYTLELKVKVSIYSQKENEIIAEKEYDPIIVHSGYYKNLQEAKLETAELELEIDEVYKEAGLTDMAVSKFSNDYSAYYLTDDISITSRSASLYSVTRDDMSKVAQLEYVYDKSDYVMVSFESTNNLPFDVGIMGISYSIPKTETENTTTNK